MTEAYNQLELILVMADRFRGGRVGLWRCSCGAEKAIPFYRVKNGSTKSCGCRRTKHGANGTPEHTAWLAMNARCRATDGRDHEMYGGRGISVCDRWKDFSAFLTDMGQKPTANHSLGRIDNDKGYAPDNCRWETAAEQARNQRRSKLWHILGETFESSRQAAARFDVDHKTIQRWANLGHKGCHVEHRY